MTKCEYANMKNEGGRGERGIVFAAMPRMRPITQHAAVLRHIYPATAAKLRQPRLRGKC